MEMLLTFHVFCRVPYGPFQAKNDQKNTNFQNVLEIDYAGRKFTLKESQVSVKQIIEIQVQETVRIFFFNN